MPDRARRLGNLLADGMPENRLHCLKQFVSISDVYRFDTVNFTV